MPLDLRHDFAHCVLSRDFVCLCGELGLLGKRMQKRKEVIEHPFGTIKWYDGAHYFLCKGKEKVSAEIALSFLTYNLRRAIKLKGAGALIAAIRQRKHKNRG